jgi:hypothetical protein
MTRAMAPIMMAMTSPVDMGVERRKYGDLRSSILMEESRGVERETQLRWRLIYVPGPFSGGRGLGKGWRNGARHSVGARRDSSYPFGKVKTGTIACWTILMFHHARNKGFGCWWFVLHRLCIILLYLIVLSAKKDVVGSSGSSNLKQGART